jgi:predicted metal-dependent hydrolase
MQKDTIQFGSTAIPYQLVFIPRKTLEIAVHPNCTVVVKAPTGTLLEAIEAKIHKRARWILRQLNYFRQFSPRTPQRQYLSGETHLYLGKQYRLKVVEGTVCGVRLSRGTFFVQGMPAPTREKTAVLLQQWYREKADTLCKEVFDKFWLTYNLPAKSKPRIQIKKMRTRWGSLSKGAILTLNIELIRAPRECIEYVICHELCHLTHHDHSPGFYRLLEKRMPDWEKRKQKLETVLV